MFYRLANLWPAFREKKGAKDSLELQAIAHTNLDWLHDTYIVHGLPNRDPSTFSEGTWTLQTHPKHLLRRYLDP